MNNNKDSAMNNHLKCAFFLKKKFGRRMKCISQPRGCRNYLPQLTYCRRNLFDWLYVL